MLEAYIDPKENRIIFEKLDDELARRVMENSFDLHDCSKIFHVLTNHNIECPNGYEIQFEMFILEGQALLESQLASLSKSDFLEICGGFAASGIMDHFPEGVESIEKQLRERIGTLTVMETIFLLKMFVQAQIGSIDNFYKLIERHLGKHSGDIGHS